VRQLRRDPDVALLDRGCESASPLARATARLRLSLCGTLKRLVDLKHAAQRHAAAIDEVAQHVEGLLDCVWSDGIGAVISVERAQLSQTVDKLVELTGGRNGAGALGADWAGLAQDLADVRARAREASRALDATAAPDADIVARARDDAAAFGCDVIASQWAAARSTICLQTIKLPHLMPVLFSGPIRGAGDFAQSSEHFDAALLRIEDRLSERDAGLDATLAAALLVAARLESLGPR